MDSPQTREALIRAQVAVAAWHGHRHHCPPCEMPKINRGPCLHGLILRDRAAAAEATLREERERDRGPMPGEATLF